MSWTLSALVKHAADTLAEIESRKGTAPAGAPEYVRTEWSCQWCHKGLGEVRPHESGIVCQPCFDKEQMELEESSVNI